MELQDRLCQLFRQVFDEDDIQLAPEMTADDIDAWDSLSHVNLIVAIEAEFDICFSQKELLTFKNVGDLQESIRSKIQG